MSFCTISVTLIFDKPNDKRNPGNGEALGVLLTEVGEGVLDTVLIDISDGVGEVDDVLFEVSISVGGTGVTAVVWVVVWEDVLVFDGISETIGVTEEESDGGDPYEGVLVETSAEDAVTVTDCEGNVGIESVKPRRVIVTAPEFPSTP